MRDCVRYAPMIGARPGELSDGEAQALASHLATCARCTGLAADLAATEGIVSEGLLARANGRDFAPFADAVMTRVDPETVRAPFDSAAAARPLRSGRTGGILSWLALHWKGTIAATAPAVAALAVFMYVQSGRHGHDTFLELASEGVDMVIQTSDGPVVLLTPEDQGS